MFLPFGGQLFCTVGCSWLTLGNGNRTKSKIVFLFRVEERCCLMRSDNDNRDHSQKKLANFINYASFVPIKKEHRNLSNSLSVKESEDLRKAKTAFTSRKSFLLF